jgi:SPW repeat
MATGSFRTNPSMWEDWLGGGIGVAVGVSPWVAGETSHEAAVLNAAQIGVLVIGLAVFELVNLRRWGEVGQLACGIWLTASPFVFSYADAGQLRYWHFFLGSLLMMLAVLELWQDRKLHPHKLSDRGKTHA